MSIQVHGCSGVILDGGNHSFMASTIQGGSQSIAEPVCIPVTYRSWRVRLAAVPGVGKTRSLTIYKNDAPTALTLSFGAAVIEQELLGVDVHFDALDTIMLVSGSTGGAGSGFAYSTIEIEPDTDGLYLYGYNCSKDVPEYMAPLGANGNAWAATSQFHHADLIGIPGDLVALACRERTAPGVGNAMLYTPYKSGVAQDGSGGSVNAQQTISGTNTVSSSSFVLPVVAGDYLSLRRQETGTPASSTVTNGTLAFRPTSPTTYLLDVTMPDMDPAGTARYAKPADALNQTWGATEAEKHFIGHPTQTTYVSSMRCDLPVATGDVGKSWTFTFRKNDSDTALVVVVNGALTTASASVSPISILDGDTWDIRSVAAGSPSALTSTSRISLGVTHAGSCAGGGEITVVADETDGETFTGRTISPRAWLTLAYDDADRSWALDTSNQPTLRAAGHLLRFGSVHRQLSNRSSGYIMGDASVEVDDTSRLLSTLEAATATQHWANREARIFLASPTTIAAAGTSHTRFRGIWRGHTSRGLQRSLTFTDILGSEFSDFNVEGTIPKRLVTLAWLEALGFTEIPLAVVNTVIPIAYGRLSDQTIETTEVGTILPYDSTLPRMPNVGCRDSADPLGTLYGSVTFVGTVTDGVSEGPISKAAGTNHYSLHSVQFGWNQVPGAYTYRIYAFNGRWLDWTPHGGLRAGSPVTWVRMFTHDNSTMDGFSDKDMAIQINTPTDGADALTGVTTTSVDTGIGVVGLTRYLGIRYIGGVPFHGWLLCGHAIQHVEELYVDELAQNIDTDTTQAGVGGIWLIPFFPGYDAALNTNGYEVTAGGETVVIIYGKVGQYGPDRGAGLVTDGTAGVEVTTEAKVPLAINFCAIEDVGDGTGNTITAAPRQVFHLLQQWVLRNYVTGAWAGPALSDDGVPWLNSGSFAALEAIEIARVGGEGYVGALYLDEPLTVRDLLGRLLTSFDMHFGQNQHGQVIAMHLNDFTVLSTTRQISDLRELVEDTDIDRRLEELENTIVLDWKWRHAEQEFEVEGVDFHDDLAIAANRDRPAIGERRQLYYVRDEATAMDVGGRALARGKYPPRYFDITCTLPSGLPVALGSVIRVTDVDGIGATGWTDRVSWVIGIEDLINDLETPPVVRLNCLDVERFFAVTGVMGDRATLVNWSTETAPNKLTYYYMADRTTGAFADGSAAKEMR